MAANIDAMLVRRERSAMASVAIDHPLLQVAKATPRLGSILTWAGLGEEAEALTRLSVDLANVHGSRLLGVSCSAHHASKRRTTVEWEAEQRLMKAAGEQFRTAAACVRAGMTWRCSDGPFASAASALSWAADLFVTNLEGSGWEDEGRAAVLDLAGRSASPVLVRPRRCSVRQINTIVILWSASPATRRAITSSLAFMARAKTVKILVDPAATPFDDDPASSLQNGLRLRGIDAGVVRTYNAAGVTNIKQAALSEADLVVTDTGFLRANLFSLWRKQDMINSMKGLALLCG